MKPAASTVSMENRERLREFHFEDQEAASPSAPAKPSSRHRPRSGQTNGSTHASISENVQKRHSKTTARSPEALSGKEGDTNRNETARSPTQISVDGIYKEPLKHRDEAPAAHDQATENKRSPAAGDASLSLSQLPNLLGRESFQLVLHNPDTAYQLLRFCQLRHCGENMEFLQRVDSYKKRLSELQKAIAEIQSHHIVVDAPSQVNIAESLRRKTSKDLELVLASVMPGVDSVFDKAQEDIERLVERGIYPRFVRHQMSLSATKALAGSTGTYAGLGDCFVLTSPSKADNPIVYASDGFVKVTGYTRKDIIPHNCRFLQGRHTDRAAVRRIKANLNDRNESVELLVNYKRDQEPFWNLLYIAPLYDGNGNLVFFLGGQVNLSSSVKNTSEIIRILSMSQDTQDQEASVEQKPKDTKSNSIFKSIRSTSKQPAAFRQAGMEEGLLKEVNTAGVDRQVDAFVAAYSKYLVINYSTFFVAFYSAGMADIFYSSKSQSSAQLRGADVFSFLKDNATPETFRGFKNEVKTALKAGRPISLNLTMGTRRTMGFEKFATHWTPLKDEHGKVDFVILTMGSSKL